MKLPNTAYEVEFLGNDEISFFPRKDSPDEKLVHLKLPKWLVVCIEYKIARAREEGRKEVRDNLNKILKGE